jgi:G3E family GTPase
MPTPDYPPGTAAVGRQRAVNKIISVRDVFNGCPMKLWQMYPDGMLSPPEAGIQELMRAILVRANFVPGVRHVIGWRGLKETFTSVEGWTAKIKRFAGVFGMYFDSNEAVDGWILGRFILSYFPDPQEDLVENFSLQAGAYTQSPDYLSHIRDFLLYPKLCELFHIGIIDLAIKKTPDALILGLESISHQRSVARDGVSLFKEGRKVELIKPGGYDQNFPSYQTALGFFQVLSASFTFNLETPPRYLRHLRGPGKEVAYEAGGRHWQNPADDIHQESLYLGYGKADFKRIIEATTSKKGSFNQDVTWERGKDVLTEYQDALWWNAHQISDYKTLDKKILGIDDRPQLIVLTGFLGSGKTSFLQHFIEYQVQLNRFVAVIQNEIGQTGLDGKLLDHDYALTEIDEGCICCTLVGNLKGAIRRILASFHPDYIVLETTGLANPYNLLDELSELDEWVRFDSITTMVDGLNIEQSIRAYEVVREQIKAADIILLNKTDLLTKNLIGKISGRLKAINSSAPILTTVRGDINPALIYGVDPMDDPVVFTKKISGKDQIQSHHTHERDGFSSYKIPFSGPLEKEDFIGAIQTLPDTVFRVKGIVEFTGDGRPLLFQYVRGRFEFSEFTNPKMSERFLILIGQDIQKEPIHNAFGNCLLY